MKIIIKQIWLVALIACSCFACSNESANQENHSEIKSETAERAKELATLEKTKVSQDGTQLEQDIYVIKYVAVNEPTVIVEAEEIEEVAAPKATFTKNEKESPQTNTPKGKENIKTPTIADIDAKVENNIERTLPQNIKYRTFGSDANRDRPPVFTKACLSAKNMSECAENSIHEYVEANLEYPEKALMKGHDGYEKVIFTVDKTGKIKPSIKVASKDRPCEGCAKAAVKVIANMPDWIPALENGQPVSTEITLPIRFDYVGRK